MNHTELPWRCTDRAQVYALGRHIAECGAPDTMPHIGEQDQANAAFIVLACNSHYKLVEALRELADASATIGNLDHAGVPVPADAWADMYQANCKARAILAEIERNGK